MGLVTLVPGLLTVVALGQGVAVPTGPELSQALRLECPARDALRLRRFEDRSAQVLCGGRVIVRISVPGR